MHDGQAAGTSNMHIWHGQANMDMERAALTGTDRGHASWTYREMQQDKCSFKIQDRHAA
jgi:hypothetical protein